MASGHSQYLLSLLEHITWFHPIDMASALETPHRALDPSNAYEVRLARLFPGPATGPVRCELVHASMDTPVNLEYESTLVMATHYPYYFALSYHWGDVSLTKPIRLSGKEYRVTTNLFAFLSQFQATLDLVGQALPHPMFLDQLTLQCIISALPQGWTRLPKKRRDATMCEQVLPRVAEYISKYRLLSHESAQVLYRRWKPRYLKDLRYLPD